MAETVKVVAEDPKAGKPRAKSGVGFPYFDLESCVDVARAIHERAGGTCDLAQLAALLDYSGIRNGSFRTRISAAKMFGLIEDAEDQKVRVTARGLAIVAPISDAQAAGAKAAAFLSVDLFKRVYDKFNGTTIPGDVGLKNLFETEYQVVPDRIVPTIRIMRDSAEYGGFFQAAGKTRMVLPLSATNPAPAPPVTLTPSSTPAQPEPQRLGGGGGGNGGGEDSGIDPAILGLLRRLPPGGTALNASRRKALVDAFTSVVNFIYPDADESL